MTKAQWRASDNPEGMLEQLKAASARKLRLFAVACCRRVEGLITDERCRRAVAAAAYHGLIRPGKNRSRPPSPGCSPRSPAGSAPSR